MSDDLTERLRDRRVCSPAQNSCRNDYICDLAAARMEELEAKLAKAVDALGEAIYLLDPDEEDIAKETGLHRIVTTYAELKGEK